MYVPVYALYVHVYTNAALSQLEITTAGLLLALGLSPAQGSNMHAHVPELIELFLLTRPFPASPSVFGIDASGVRLGARSRRIWPTLLVFLLRR